MILKRLLKLFLLIAILVNLYMCAYPVLHNDVGYSGDIARDFLILQDTVNTHKLPLIGPRTGGIDGLFHGPIWPWINLPVFILSHGNPVATGWFWVVLIVCSVAICYYVGKKLFNDYVGLLAALLMSLIYIPGSSFLLNPFVAALLSPLFLYFFYKYIKSTRVFYLMLSFFVTGLMIQSEVAFGGPILILSLAYLLIFLYKKKKLSHLLSIFILLIPLSTYILFDLRHNFLQLRSILGHVGAPTGNGKEVFGSILQNRFNGALNSLMTIPYSPFWITLAIIALFIYIAVKSYRDKKLKNREFYLLFSYFYLGYWPLSFYLNGDVLGIHIFPFMPIAVIIFASSHNIIRKELFVIFFITVLFFNFTYAKGLIDNFSSYSSYDAGSWQFNYKLAKTVFNNAGTESGYYVFTPDELGYGPKYAITYVNKEYPKKIAYAYSKKHETFIILAPTSNGVNNNQEWWIKNKVKISKPPEQIINYPNGYKLEKFILSNQEIKIPSDPNLISGLSYR